MTKKPLPLPDFVEHVGEGCDPMEPYSHDYAEIAPWAATPGSNAEERRLVCSRCGSEMVEVRTNPDGTAPHLDTDEPAPDVPAKG